MKTNMEIDGVILMMKPDYNLTYCSCCGKPIYYKGKFTFKPTICGDCEN